MASKNPAGRPATAAGRGNVRGTKRTCQNDACGARFYDLNRDPIECPICGTVYVILVDPDQVAEPVAETGLARDSATPSDPLPTDDVSVTDGISELEVAEEDLDDAAVGFEIDDEDDADDEIEGVRGPGRHQEPD